MNITYKPRVVVALALCAALGSARAQEVTPESPSPDGPALSRAEVLADLEIWRESGMASLTDYALAADEHKAKARYAALRASPKFAELVKRIAESRGDATTIASQRK